MKHIDTLVLGAYGVNCYLLWNHNHVLIIDPGTPSKQIKKRIDEGNGIVDGIYLTHGHFDHIGGVDDLVSYYNCPVYINSLDMDMLKNPLLNASMGMYKVIVQTPVKGLYPGINTLGTFQVELIDAPGHTEGSSLMIWENNLFPGDVLFKESIGRVDLPTGSNSKMQQTLQMITNLPYDYTIYPGHGEPTTLLYELNYNPYLK